MDTERQSDSDFEAELAASLKRTQELARRNRGRGRPEAGDLKPETRNRKPEITPVRPAPPKHAFKPAVGENQLPPGDRQEVAR